MEYVVLGIVVLVVLIVFSYLSSKKKKKKTLQEIQDQWGKEKKNYINFDKVQRYSDSINDNAFHEISAQTINDIDFFELFAFIDRTTSTVGQQYLYNLLKKPIASVDELRRRNEQANFFRSNADTRQKIQLELKKLSSSYGYSIPLLIGGQLIDRPKWHKWLVLDISLLIGFLLASFKLPTFILFALPIAALNVIYLNFLNSRLV